MTIQPVMPAALLKFGFFPLTAHEKSVTTVFASVAFLVRLICAPISSNSGPRITSGACALGQSSARDLSVTIGVLTDKRRQLKPEGGPIQTYKDYQKMDAVLKELHAEAVRSGWLDNDGLTPKGAALAVNTGNSSLP